MIKYIVPGDKIKIYPDNEVIRDTDFYVSSVEEIYDDENYRISAPMKNGKIYPLHEKEICIIDFHTNSCVFRCEVQILDRMKENRLLSNKVKIKANTIRKIQRRSYFRIDCLVDIIIDKIDSKDSEIPNLELPETTTVKNISGGGLQFISKHKMEEGTEVQGVIKLPLSGRYHDLPVCMELIDRVPIDDGISFKFLYRAKFHKLFPQDRENIIRFVFEQQIKQKGK